MGTEGKSGVRKIKLAVNKLEVKTVVPHTGAPFSRFVAGGGVAAEAHPTNRKYGSFRKILPSTVLPLDRPVACKEEKASQRILETERIQQTAPLTEINTS